VLADYFQNLAGPIIMGEAQFLAGQMQAFEAGDSQTLSAERTLGLQASCTSALSTARLSRPEA
jgi:hypothetical protein